MTPAVDGEARQWIDPHDPAHAPGPGLYFTSTSRLGEDSLHAESTRTSRARDLYTYGHVLVVAAIILTAVGDEIVIAHPLQPLPGPQLLAVVAGPGLFLAAQLALHLRATGRLAYGGVAGVASCAAIGLLASALPAVVVGAALVVTLVAVAAIGSIAQARRLHPGAASAGTST